MTNLAEEKPPTFSIVKIMQLRDSLYDALVGRYAEISISDIEDLDLLLDDLMPRLPKGILRGTMFETFRPFMGSPYPATWWREFFWRVAGNESLLASGVPLRPWRAPGVKEWVPIQIMRVDPAPAHKSDHRYMLHCKALAGQACPLVWQKIVTGAWLKRLSSFTGFTKFKGARPYLTPYQFTGLRLVVLLDPALSRDGKPNFFDLRCSGSHLEHNNGVLSRRYRRGFECPKSFDHECHVCAIGYTECPAATHMATYTQGACSECGPDAWFDPEVSTQICVQCWRKKLVKGS